ncbi:hypothetical protein [Hansschlegelia beijingensis]|uniref:Uncharacterized protein n=1 Tax=Hansschlegelia beijingensis TaxID=1133344 RepID=A0A7W6GFV9_9HYPH|nr:hypothetical protein [Hansschlegelia beijingensis]MBB3974341.1 hypothetical protein [Hansschlegelia beijingensis]
MNAQIGSAEAVSPQVGEERVEAVFRNGTITAYGITVSFTLGFLSQWASSADAWRLYDVPAVAAVFAGGMFQIWALALLLPVEGLVKTIYDRATRLYLIGLALTGTGVVTAVSFDVARGILGKDVT